MERRILPQRKRIPLAREAVHCGSDPGREPVIPQRRYAWALRSRGKPEAQTEAAQLLEDEAIRRAHEGILTPVFYKGNPTGVMREYSDALLMFLLRGFTPEKYRDRGSVEVSGPAGGPIAVTDKRLETLSDDELDSLITIGKKLDSAC
jgi:hypothetical protein